jgi:hypothetical protein
VLCNFLRLKYNSFRQNWFLCTLCHFGGEMSPPPTVNIYEWRLSAVCQKEVVVLLVCVRADASIRASICRPKLCSDANPKWHHANPMLQLASIVGWTHFVRCHVLNHSVSATSIFHLQEIFLQLCHYKPVQYFKVESDVIFTYLEF